MNTQNTPPAVKNNKPWRLLYIQLLTDGPTEQSTESARDAQRLAVCELISGRFADGRITRDEKGEISGFMNFSPLPEGRLLADRLIAEEDASSTMGKLKAVGLFASGAVFTAILDWCVNFLSP